MINLPKWILKETGSYFLLIAYPGGQIDVDGGHDDIEGVVKARRLYNTIFADKGAKFKAIKIVDIPDIDVAINEEAANTCAELWRAQMENNK
jgi:hypothetical protein